MLQELFPFVLLAPKSIKFELSALLPFRKYIAFSTLPGIKIAHFYTGYLKTSLTVAFSDFFAIKAIVFQKRLVLLLLLEAPSQHCPAASTL